MHITAGGGACVARTSPRDVCSEAALMGFDHETSKAASARNLQLKIQRKQGILARQRLATNAARAAARSRLPQQGAAGLQLLPGLSVKHVELRTGCATRSSSRLLQRVVNVRSELDAGAAAVVVRLDGEIVAVAFAPQVLTLLQLSWPSRRRCQNIARSHRFGCSKNTGFADADVVNCGLATRSGKKFATGMVQQVQVRAQQASHKTDPTFEQRARIHRHALTAVQEHALIDDEVEVELKLWARKHRKSSPAQAE